MDKKGSVTLQVEGLFCTGCVEDMQTILRNTEGILDASVDYSTGRITIRHDPGIIDEKQVFIKVSNFGFKTKIIEKGL